MMGRQVSVRSELENAAAALRGLAPGHHAAFEEWTLLG